MAVRITVGVLCALFAIGLLATIGYGYGAYVSIVISIFSAIAVYEIMKVSQCKNKVLTGFNMAVAFIIPLLVGFDIAAKLPAGICIAIYIMAMLILNLKMYDKTRFENTAIGIFSSLAVPFSTSSLTMTWKYMENFPEIYSRSSAIFVILMAMYCAWLCDTFALFTGMSFGKHKLAPTISPKKSVEGAIGGAVGTTVVAMITWFIFHKWFFHFDTITWWMTLILVPAVCVMGMCGDLAASVIKRNYGVKDFGTMFPEHGGAMDRIDSFLFTMPSAYILVRLLTEIFAR